MEQKNENSDKLQVKLCMGSSCFSRGNNVALKHLQDYIKLNSLDDEVLLCGSLCEELCKTGPHVFVDGTHYENVDPSTVIDFLEMHLDQRGTSK